MQVVDFCAEDQKDSLASWLILEACTLNDELNGTEDTVVRVCKDIPGDRLQVQFTVNGIELPFLETMATLNEQFENQVQRAAIKLMEEKFSNIYNSVNEFEDKLIKTLKKEFNFGID